MEKTGTVRQGSCKETRRPRGSAETSWPSSPSHKACPSQPYWTPRTRGEVQETHVNNLDGKTLGRVKGGLGCIIAKGLARPFFKGVSSPSISDVLFRTTRLVDVASAKAMVTGYLKLVP